MLSQRSFEISESRDRPDGPHPKNSSNSKERQPHRSIKLADRFKKETVSKSSLKQNSSDREASDSTMKHPLYRKTVRFLADSIEGHSLTQSNSKANIVNKMSCYSIDVSQLLKRRRPELQLARDRLQRMWRRRVAWGFQKIKEQELRCETSESQIPVHPSSVYNYDALPALLEAYSVLYKLRYQKIMVEAFSKISFEFKTEQAKQTNLKNSLAKNRAGALLNPLIVKFKSNRLVILLKGGAFRRFATKIRTKINKKSVVMSQSHRNMKFTTRTFTEESMESSCFTSTNKISRLLAAIKKEKDQPSERIYVDHSYNKTLKTSGENISSVVDQLTERVHRLQQMLADSQNRSSAKISCPLSQNKPELTERKFQTSHMISKSELVSDKSLPNLKFHFNSNSVSRQCNKCMLSYCICNPTQTKSIQTQTINLNSTMPIPAKQLFRDDSRQRSPRHQRIHSVPKKVITLIPKRQLEVVYVQQTVYRPILVEKIAPPQPTIYQTIVPVKSVPRMAPDIIDPKQQPVKRDLSGSVERQSRFLKVTVKR